MLSYSISPFSSSYRILLKRRHPGFLIVKAIMIRAHIICTMCHQNCQGAQAWTCHSKTSMDILNNQSCKTAPCSMYKRTYHNKISMDILNNQSCKTAALLTYKRMCHSKTFMDILNSQSYKTAPCSMYMRTCHSKRSMDILNNHVHKHQTTMLLLYIQVSHIPTTLGLLFKHQAALYP